MHADAPRLCRRAAANDESLVEVLAMASAFVEEAEQQLNEQLAAVSASLDWHDPRIAFYGETNAGKSALIEALRLFFHAHHDVPGLTIGTGKPDFTREARSYRCEHQGLRFDLIDVPGIEGDEARVTTEIQAAINSSHLVFLVTAEPKPPQVGDDGAAGTLEKIKSHLRPQSRIWAIYNKKVTTPEILEETLVTDSERTGLTGGAGSLDGALHCALGKQYQGHICTSALPAFLAMATSPGQDWRFARKQVKFLAHADAREILRLSRLEELAGLITRSVPSPRDIFVANVSKLSPWVVDAADDLARRADHAFLVPAESLRGRLTGLERDLLSIADDASRSMGRLADEIADGCIKRLRDTMLEAIGSGIGDDEALKRRLDAAVEGERASLGRIVTSRLDATSKRIQASCEEAMHTLANRLRRDDAFESSIFAASFSHASKVDTRSGIDWVGLGGSALGLAIAGLAVATGGVVVAVLGALGSLMGIWNSIKFFLDGDFHKDQQKRALNANLDEVRPVVRVAVVAALEEAKARLRGDVFGILERLRAIVDEHEDAWRRVQVAVATFRMLADEDDRLYEKAKRFTVDATTPAEEAALLHPISFNER
jgi:hypothetical protein